MSSIEEPPGRVSITQSVPHTQSQFESHSHSQSQSVPIHERAQSQDMLNGRTQDHKPTTTTTTTTTNTNTKKKKRGSRNKNKNKTQVPKNKSEVSLDSLQVPKDSGPEIADLTSTISNSKSIQSPKITEKLQPAFNIKQYGSHTNNLSPRKQTLMRHKNSDDESNYINEVKSTLKSNKTSPCIKSPASNNNNNNNNNTSTSTTNTTTNNHNNNIDANGNSTLDMEDKVTLFKYKSAKILVYESSYTSTNGGTLLSSGELEIFQLHKGDITYLSCGSSFIYPLLPKLKLLRISSNEFIIPLLNPARYWKIVINSDEPNVIQVLQGTFERIVNYSSLLENDNNINNNINNNNENLEQTTPTTFNHFPLISHEIPESPPSAPLSPHDNGLQFNHNISPLKRSIPTSPFLQSQPTLNKKSSSHSITTAMACLDVSTKNLIHPKPKRLPTNSNPYQLNNLHEEDTKSDSSSMDSLLDEYEENITNTKSITFTKSRPPTRPQSITSSIKFPHHPHPPPHPPQFSRTYIQDSEQEFPSTSLSEYNRTHNGVAARSRRSSRSELYNSESNWMEPNFDLSQTNNVNNPNLNNNNNINNNIIPRILTRSRSNQSINSASQHSHSLPHGQSSSSFDLNRTYRNIYKSIAQRNLKSTNYFEEDLKNFNSNSNSNSNSVSARLPTITAKVPSEFSAGQKLSKSAYNPRDISKLKGSIAINKDVDPTGLRLESSEIYQLISKRDNFSTTGHRARTGGNKHQSDITTSSGIPRSTSFTSRLFGW
ncbi:inheritance of peroxisomes protein 1-domain-containing protein [Scheffersomyces amazonensis]|uniref:inheritance of peroxisomes protein 1-domain-containing protein n=1 Tax=Scheffersomyces amazonensis TaxID=1078765 RepID=UPI00315D4835